MKAPARIYVICLLTVSLVVSVSLVNYSPTDDPRIEKIIRQFSLFRAKCKQQKVYLHMDKDTYLAGETVWMKAYLVDATTFLPDTVSKDIYIELLDFNNKSIQNIILRNQNGFSKGDLPLKDTLLEGNYQIRAYTNWMRNFSEDYFYYKTITIKSPNYENVVTNARLKEIKHFNRIQRKAEKKYVLHFFPEGGNLVNGLQNRVAFKAENILGIGQNIKGFLVDNKGTQLAPIQSVHDGMGSFEFMPKQGMKYYAKITYENGKSDKYALPRTLDKGVVMTVDPFGKDNVRIIIQSNRPVSENIASNEIIIVAQSRGFINYISKGEIKDKQVVSNIPKKLLPAGITQITLFDGRGEPLCERLVFMDPKIETGTNKVNVTSKTQGDSIVCNVNITMPNGSPVSGNVSLAVVETLPSPGDRKSESILTNLLLTSDLKGRINDPSYYFDPSNPEAFKNTDLLMMTHGWRRFVWKEIMANKFAPILYPMIGGISISGRITRDFFGIPIGNSKVKLSILKTYNDQFETVTDSKGRFEFPLMEYEDTIDVKIEAFKPSGGKGVQIVLGDTLTPDINYKPYPAFLNETYNKRKIKANNRRERMDFKTKLKNKPEEDNIVGKIHETPNDVMKVGDDVNSYSNILQYMQGKVPGVNIVGNRVIIRGVSTFYGSTDPLFLMDGVPIDASTVPSINPSDINRIEILKGPEAAIYGSRGANGVIAFYSKRGQFMKRGVIEFGMLGYHKTREFYVPAYDSWAYKPTDYNVPRTLFWKPMIKTDSTGSATIRFTKKITTEKFSVVLEGITNSGDLIYFKNEQ
jgi:TonB-dependent SusC/RagA subfamily outer membrane receptor